MTGGGCFSHKTKRNFAKKFRKKVLETLKPNNVSALDVSCDTSRDVLGITEIVCEKIIEYF